MTAMTSASATVVVPCLNSAATLGGSLGAVNRQSERDRLHLLVVDNGSDDDSVAVARRLADEVLNVTPHGVANARNAGLARARTPLVLSLDADCVPADHLWARRHLECLQRQADEVLATAGRLLPAPGDDQWAQRADITPHPAVEDGQPLYAVAGNACYRTEALRRLGGFPHYMADDAALGYLARNRGLRFVWVGDAAVFHHNPPDWRGYARQMRKVGGYAAELVEPPRDFRSYYSQQLRQAASAVRPLLKGDMHEALAVMTRAVAQTIGAREVWRRGRCGPPFAP